MGIFICSYSGAKNTKQEMMLPIHQKKIMLIIYFECWKKIEERKCICVTYYTKNIG